MEPKYGFIIGVQHVESQDYGAAVHYFTENAGHSLSLQTCDGDRVVSFPADEPLFLLRGQDQLALNAVWHYYETCKKMGQLQHAEAVYMVWLQMAQWQQEHPERVKLPD